MSTTRPPSSEPGGAAAEGKASEDRAASRDDAEVTSEGDTRLPTSAPSSPEPPQSPTATSTIEPRQCWICLESEDDDAGLGSSTPSNEGTRPASPVPLSGNANKDASPPDSPRLSRLRTFSTTPPKEEWVRPCKCRGSTATCHQKCIRTWVQRKRETDPNKPVLCPSCQTPYTIRAKPRPLLIRFAHSLADVYALTPAILFVVAITYGFYLLAAEYGRLAIGALLGSDAASVLSEGHAAWQPSWGLGFYHRMFTLSLVAMLFTPLDVVFGFFILYLFGGMPGNHAIVSTMLVAADVPSYLYRLIILRLVIWIRRKFGWAAMARLQTFPPVAALAAAGVLWAVPAVADEINAHEDDEDGNREDAGRERARQDQADRADEQQLRRLARAVSFPNASVVTSQRAISSTSFVLKIFVLEDRQNARNQAGNDQPAPAQMVPRALYVEYERANILLAVIRSRFFSRAQTAQQGNLAHGNAIGVAPRNLRPAAVAAAAAAAGAQAQAERRQQRAAAREQQRLQRRAARAAQQQQQQQQQHRIGTSMLPSVPLIHSPGPMDPPYMGQAFGSPVAFGDPAEAARAVMMREREREIEAARSPNPEPEADLDIAESPSFGSNRKSSNGSERGRTLSIERLEAAVKGDEDNADDGDPDREQEEPDTPDGPKTAKGKEKLDLVTGIGGEPPAAAPNVVEIPAGPPPLVRLETDPGRPLARPFPSSDRPAAGLGVPSVGGEFYEQNPVLYQPTPMLYRPTSPPTVSTVRRRKERSRDVGHVRRSSGKGMSESIKPLATSSSSSAVLEGRDGATSPNLSRSRSRGDRSRSPIEPGRVGTPHNNNNNNNNNNAANPPPQRPAQPAGQPPAGAAQIQGPREAFLAIDVRTVRTHVYHLVAHTLLLPFVVAFLAEYLVFPITSIIYSYVLMVSPGQYLIMDFLHWLGRELITNRASRSVMAGLCYGIGREVSVRWWRGRMKQERSDFTVEDWKAPAAEAAATAAAQPVSPTLARANTAPANLQGNFGPGNEPPAGDAVG